MPLSQLELAVWRKARAAGAGGQTVQLTDAMCGYLLAMIIADLRMAATFPNVPPPPIPFYAAKTLADTELAIANPLALYEQLVEAQPDAVTYFACLSALQKARLKYARILTTQPFPTLDQVGPRGLLQYGHISAGALATFLYWRKWFFDIDNRAGQETGYLFEPVIASAIGGVPLGAKKSPVKSHRDRKGRQVDCLIENDAYELKIRVTIAASGQGRWREELDYPIDCRSSGYRPVLIVLDGTRNQKLDELIKAFENQGGVTHVGQAAWTHLDDLAGEVMAQFLEKYVRAPLADLLTEAPQLPLPELHAQDHGDHLTIRIWDEELRIERAEEATENGGDELADDVSSSIIPTPE